MKSFFETEDSSLARCLSDLAPFFTFSSTFFWCVLTALNNCTTPLGWQAAERGVNKKQKKLLTQVAFIDMDLLSKKLISSDVSWLLIPKNGYSTSILLSNIHYNTGGFQFSIFLPTYYQKPATEIQTLFRSQTKNDTLHYHQYKNMFQPQKDASHSTTSY